MEKSFTTYRNAVDTSAGDSDDLFLDDSETDFRVSLPSSTIAFPQDKKDSLPLPKGYQDIEETDDEDHEPLVTYKKSHKKKRVLDSDEDVEVHHESTNNDKSSTSPEPKVENDDSQSENEDSQSEYEDSYPLEIDESYSSESDDNQDSSNSSNSNSKNKNSSQNKKKFIQERKSTEKNSLPLPKDHLVIAETDDEDHEPLVTYKKSHKKKQVLDSDEDLEVHQESTNNDKSSTSPEPKVENDDSQSENEDSQSEYEDSHLLKIDESYNSESDDHQDSSNSSNSNYKNKNSSQNKKNFIQERKSTKKEQNNSIRESVILSSTEDLSNDIVEVSSGPDEVTLVTYQSPKPSTPKLKQTKIFDMYTPKKASMPLSAIPSNNNPVGNVNFVAPSGKKFVTKTDFTTQQNKVAVLQQNLLQTQNALNTHDLETLPDRGALLKHREVLLAQELAKERHKLSTMLIEPKTEAPGEKVYGLSWQELRALSNQVQPAGMGGKQAMETYHTQKTLTMDRLKSLHQSLEAKPNADVMVEDPKMLRVELMPHQKHALAFLLWREGQKPAGGILADDMGLGKTLTMISLILKTKEFAENDENKKESESEESSNDENDEEKERKRRREYYPGGTLVVCPASLINQWENEIRRHCKRDCLSVHLYHGSNREFKSRRLAKHDVVITTYNLAGLDREKSDGIFAVRWSRIILDEAHVIRNAKANCSIGVCALKGKKRWCLTGTPIQNKELDLYALLKFLKCSPFDDLQIWKKWIDNKSAGGQERLNTVIQSIMLRRTKQQLQDNGTITSLPEKTTELIEVKLTKDEMNIYQKILIFSKTLFAQFLHQRAEKNSDLAYSAGTQAKFLNGNPNPEYEKVHQKLLKMHGTGEVKAHQILVLLLRLRQTCCHVGLIKSMIENEEACAEDGIEDTDGTDIDLLAQLENLDINADEENSVNTSTNIQNEDDGAAGNSGSTLNAAASKLLNSNNPIFNTDQASSKVKTVIKTLKETALAKGDKAIVVSQWTSMLKIVEAHLVRQGIKCATLDGKVPVNKRMILVDDFNKRTSDLQILLLSLTAGGVGLNLIGANHLLLIDLHWNPQLESQAQDRIYRFGQKKDIFIYKFVTVDTIEERIKALQERKLEMASNLLTGTKQAGNKLSIEDLKMLFSME